MLLEGLHEPYNSERSLVMPAKVMATLPSNAATTGSIFWNLWP